MVRSVECQKHFDLACKIDREIKAIDPRLSRSVQIMTNEVSLFYDNAFLMRNGHWIYLFAEHHACEVFHDDGELMWAVYERRYDKLEEVKEEMQCVSTS